jgi:hypothetical protein
MFIRAPARATARLNAPPCAPLSELQSPVERPFSRWTWHRWIVFRPAVTTWRIDLPITFRHRIDAFCGFL